MTDFRLDNASKTFGSRASSDHLGELTENVLPVLVTC